MKENERRIKIKRGLGKEKTGRDGEEARENVNLERKREFGKEETRGEWRRRKRKRVLRKEKTGETVKKKRKHELRVTEKEKKIR